MFSSTRNGDNGNGSADRVKAGQRRAIAQDMKARGGNPVTVSDICQRNATGQRRGGAFLSTLLNRG